MKWKGALGFVRAKGFFLLAATSLILIAGAAVYARTRLIAPAAPESGNASARLAAAAASVSPPTASPSPVPSPTPEPLSWPVSGREVLRAEATQPVWVEPMGAYETHPGVDIRAEEGEDVLAAADGTVASVGYDPRWGYMVAVQSADGLVTRYGNLSKATPVSSGDRVRRGQSVGTVASSAPSARVIGPFLHFEAFRGGVTVALP